MRSKELSDHLVPKNNKSYWNQLEFCLKITQVILRKDFIDGSQLRFDKSGGFLFWHMVFFVLKICKEFSDYCQWSVYLDGWNENFPLHWSFTLCLDLFEINCFFLTNQSLNDRFLLFFIFFRSTFIIDKCLDPSLCCHWVCTHTLEVCVRFERRSTSRFTLTEKVSNGLWRQWIVHFVFGGFAVFSGNFLKCILLLEAII